MKQSAPSRSENPSGDTAPAVSAADDAAERAADSAAGRLLAGRDTGPIGASRTGEDGAVPEAARARAAAISARPGQQLPAALRAEFEPRFGCSLSGIRLQTDAAAGAAARGIGAAAFTHHGAIAFAPGHYAPETLWGRQILGHEIAHSLQQAAGGAPVIQRQRAVNPEIARLPAERYVDAFREITYDFDYRSEGGNLSRWMTATYPDGAQIDINIFSDIEDRESPMVEAMANGRLGPQGRIFPVPMTRTTVPRLWAARTEAINRMEEFNLSFMLAAMPAVFFIITMPVGMVGGGAPRATSRSVPRTRGGAGRTGSGGAGAGGTGAAGAAARTGATATSTAAASTASTAAAAGPSFRIVGGRVYRYAQRDIVVVETSVGRQAFYRRTGRGGSNAGGAQPGDWAPFDGILGGWFEKSRYVVGSADDALYRWLTPENRAVSRYLVRMGIRVGDDVGEVFFTINEYLRELGALRMGAP